MSDPVDPADNIHVTPAMVEAGRDALYGSGVGLGDDSQADDEDYKKLMTAIFVAMTIASRNTRNDA